MNKVILFLILFTSIFYAQLISFENPLNWNAGSGSLNTYQSDHEYIDYVNGYRVVFTAQYGLQETNGMQDGFNKTHNNSTYSWNLENSSSSSFKIKIEATQIDGFSFYLRKWENVLNTKYIVTVSTNNGISFVILATLDDTFFNNSSDWKKFEYNSQIKADSDQYPIILKINPFLTNPNSGNLSILIDDFSIDNPLPVELTTFSASVISNYIELAWETATEINNYGFNVERAEAPSSITAPKEWNKVGFVNGHGNSNSHKSYSFVDKNVIEAGKYFYRLKQVDIDGSYEYSSIVEVDFKGELEYKLNQNFPNPFNPTTTISFTIPPSEVGNLQTVRLTVFNLIGEQVAELINKNVEAGNHNVEFNAGELNSGIYIYKLQVDNNLFIKKMMLIK